MCFTEYSNVLWKLLIVRRTNIWLLLTPFIGYAYWKLLLCNVKAAVTSIYSTEWKMFYGYMDLVEWVCKYIGV
jgi:hypothetical protein